MNLNLKKLLMRSLPIRTQIFIRSVRARKRLRIGHGSYVHPHAQVLGLAHVKIGSNSCISEACWLNVNHRTDDVLAIEIGNNCWIGRDNFFSSGKNIQIADYCLTTIGCKFISSSHITDDPLAPYLTTGTTSHQSIRVGVNCFFGAGAMVMGNVRIGHGSVIAANAMVLHDLPPFCVAIGNPARIVKRYSFTRQAWCELDAFSEMDLAGQPDEESYLQLLRARHGDIDMPWIAAGSNLGNL